MGTGEAGWRLGVWFWAALLAVRNLSFYACQAGITAAWGCREHGENMSHELTGCRSPSLPHPEVEPLCEQFSLPARNPGSRQTVNFILGLVLLLPPHCSPRTALDCEFSGSFILQRPPHWDSDFIIFFFLSDSLHNP